MRHSLLNEQELIDMQNCQNLENLLKRIKIMKREFYNEMISYGMTEETIKRAFNGKEIFNCKSCNTPNLYESYHDKTKNISFYKCDNCGNLI
jgi:hypothetical protein